jgi:hypothetical protein
MQGHAGGMTFFYEIMFNTRIGEGPDDDFLYREIQ